MNSVKLVLVTAIYLETVTWLTPLCTAYQYFVPGRNDDYKYGYRTDADALVARQEADRRNQVSGQHFYKGDLGNFGLKYTSPAPFDLNDDRDSLYPQGVQEGRYTSTFENTNQPRIPQNQNRRNFPFTHIWNYQKQLPTNPLFMTPYYLMDVSNKHINYWQYPQEDRSYNFSFDTGNYKKHESSDSLGNIRGYFEYEDDGGFHDLSYYSNDTTGSCVTGGNLARNFPDCLNNRDFGNFNADIPFTRTIINYPEELQKLSQFLNDLLDRLYSLPYKGPKNRSYYFKFESDKYKIQETSDRNGNINGNFIYREDSGSNKDLSYEINDRNGFRVTGGSLADNRNWPAVDGFNNVAHERKTSISDNNANDDDIKFVFGKTTMNPFIKTE